MRPQVRLDTCIFKVCVSLCLIVSGGNRTQCNGTRLNTYHAQHLDVDLSGSGSRLHNSGSTAKSVCGFLWQSWEVAHKREYDCQSAAAYLIGRTKSIMCRAEELYLFSGLDLAVLDFAVPAAGRWQFPPVGQRANMLFSLPFPALLDDQFMNLDDTVHCFVCLMSTRLWRDTLKRHFFVSSRCKTSSQACTGVKPWPCVPGTTRVVAVNFTAIIAWKGTTTCHPYHAPCMGNGTFIRTCPCTRRMTNIACNNTHFCTETANQTCDQHPWPCKHPSNEFRPPKWYWKCHESVRAASQQSMQSSCLCWACKTMFYDDVLREDVSRDWPTNVSLITEHLTFAIIEKLIKTWHSKS